MKANPSNLKNITPTNLTADYLSQNVVNNDFLEQSLDLLNKLEDNANKVNILNNIALKYIQIDDQNKATEILEKSFIITQKLSNKNQKISLLTEIAKYYQLMGNQAEANKIIDQSLNIANTVEDSNLRATLIFEIALQYDLIGESEKAKILFKESQNLIAESQLKFPFREKQITAELGLTGSVNSFTDTTAFIGFNLDLYKQWPRQDYWFDGNLFLDYDSSRSLNNTRPGGQLFSLYRYYISPKWSFFTNLFATANNDLFAPKNDDEDITFISTLALGGSYNLWRGKDNEEFLEFQVGLGPRYEYDYINFQLARNEVNPIVYFGLLGRNFSWGKIKVNQLFTFTPTINNLNNYILGSQTKLSIPITKRWSFSNNLFVRYRNERILDSNPKVKFVFSTGFDYKF